MERNHPAPLRVVRVIAPQSTTPIRRTTPYCRLSHRNQRMASTAARRTIDHRDSALNDWSVSPSYPPLGDRRLSPSIEAIKKLGRALRTPSDLLLFDHDERGPDGGLRLQFEAVRRLDPDEKLALKTVIEGVITKHEA